jgi:hypothetical protein
MVPVVHAMEDGSKPCGAYGDHVLVPLDFWDKDCSLQPGSQQSSFNIASSRFLRL